jgi:hypothetical protein
MSRGQRPWWASDADAATVARVDPLEAHRAARRGPVPLDGPEAWWHADIPPFDAATEADGADSDGAREGTPRGTPSDEQRERVGGEGRDGHRPDICGVCPICVGLRALGESRPQLVEHLTEAARHLAAAVRSVVEEPHRPRPDGSRPGRDPDPDPFERIDLD